MKDVTICLTHFKSLELANFDAALHSVRAQDLSRVASLVIVDNNSDDETEALRKAVFACDFPLQISFTSRKHGDPLKTHSWSTNVAVREVQTPLVFFTRSDYVLDFDILQSFLAVFDARLDDWNGFVTSNGCHLHAPVADCEQTPWRTRGCSEFRELPGTEFDYTRIDSGVWMATKAAFDRVGGMDENLFVWGHAQTHFQHKLHVTGTDFVRIPKVMFYHPHHGAPRDIECAHLQLKEQGIDLKEMWKRYEGPSPY